MEGTAPYSRMDLLDIEMNLILHDLGRHDMVCLKCFCASFILYFCPAERVTQRTRNVSLSEIC